MNFDKYKEPANFKAIAQRAFDTIYAGHYITIEDDTLPAAQLATGAMIAAILEGLLPKEEPEVARFIDDRITPLWNILAYVHSEGVGYFLFKASTLDWERKNVDFSVYKNIWNVSDPLLVPLFVARLRYSLEKDYIIKELKTKPGRENLLALSEGFGCDRDDDSGERLLTYWDRLDEFAKAYINRYAREITGEESLSFGSELPW